MKKTWYQLPEKDCERLNRQQMNALRWCIAAVNSCAYAQEDLASRLDCIPNGRVRWRLMLGQLRACVNDLIGTIPYKQCVNVKGVMNDMELRLVPKLTRNTDRVSMSVDDLSYLVKHAKIDICTACILNGDECRQCDLYKILEAIAPLSDWGSSTVCPYLRNDWWEK